MAKKQEQLAKPKRVRESAAVVEQTPP
ncbi:hypothetical protein CCACVL1_20470 [Corchorus capsularis]|uniref:Uncharacterized protein n=1 Tax=Corchorus capsularis TaxID=210143 RepID=A0A1R3HB14_COCAP|nr:hypothetical protein CCACVL1_20470 [Corchorus capsularis]